MITLLVIISWMLFLLSGFDDSVPPTGDKTFKIETRPNIVKSIEIISDKKLPFWGFDIELKQNSADYLEIVIPKNLPTPASYTNTWYVEPPFVLVNETELGHDIVDDPCFDIYKIPISNQTKIEFVYPVILAGTWQLYSQVEFDESNPCYHKTLYEKHVEPPLKQFKSGVPIDQIQCKKGLELLIKASNGQPTCVTPGSKSKLVERGWAFESYQSFLVQPKIITNAKNETGLITWKNQTYYFETPHYTQDAYANQTQVSIRDVVFTLFPQPFSGGLPTSFCGGSYYWANAEFSDGTSELLKIFVNSRPCPDDSIPIAVSNHSNPQAGLAFINGSFRLLVSDGSNNQDLRDET